MSMTTFVSFFLLGISLSAPVGPISAAQLNNGISKGFLASWLVGVGAMVGDALFMLMIYLGVVQFLMTPFMKSFLWSFGFFVLVYTGVESIVSSAARVSAASGHSRSASKAFRTGFFMAISNPLNIMFWLGIYGAVLAKATEIYSDNELTLYTAAIFLGISLWNFVIAVLASSFRRVMNPAILQLISAAAGVCLIGFGCYFGYQAYLQLFVS